MHVKIMTQFYYDVCHEPLGLTVRRALRRASATTVARAKVSLLELLAELRLCASGVRCAA